ncbi:MAG: YtxH domain-containing protein [Endomicrobium sp.]|jgi:gas vesicle protein|nr:YtxH domain-containing protein [Endomicrobium sp.]
MSDNRDIFFTFILGGLIGAVFGILYAPKSGKETRRNIKNLGEEIVNTISELNEDVVGSNRKIFEERKEEVLEENKNKIDKVFETGKQVFVEKYSGKN